MNKVVKNYFYNMSYQILIMIVPLITTPYVSRVLGAKGVGAFSFTNSIVQYFILFGCIGLNLYGQREIAYVQHDKKRRDKVFFEIMIIRVFTVSISLLIYLFSLTKNENYGHIFILMSLDVIASLVDISWFFQGIEDFKKIVIRNLFVKIIGVFLIFAFVKSSDDLLLYVLCHSGTLLLGNMSMWLYIPKIIKKKNLHGLEIKKHIRPTIVLFIPQIATSIYTVLDKTMIGFITKTDEEVAFYEQSQKIVKIVLTIVTSLGTVMLPRVANMFKLNELDKIKSYLMNSSKFTFFLSFPMMFGLMALSQNIVPWFFGNGYDKVILNMRIISPILVLIAFSSLIGNQYLLPLGKQREYTASVMMGTIVNIVLNLILIPKFLSLGAALATVIAEFSVTIMQLYFIRNDFDFFIIIKENIKYIFASFLMFIPTIYISNLMSSSIIHTLIGAMVGTILYFVILIILQDSVVLSIINNILGKIKNKFSS